MQENIIPHRHKIDLASQIRLKVHLPKVLWFTGLSGSGKSTLASELQYLLHARGIHTYILDGDNIRSGLNRDLDFSIEGRKENIRRISEVSKLFNDAGIVVLTAFISPLAEDRAAARKAIGQQHFLEIYVECPLEVCEARDVKGLYAKARSGEIKDFTGIGSPFEAPLQPDFKVNTAENSFESCVNDLLSFVSNQVALK